MATYTPTTGLGAGTPLNFHLLIDPPERETRQQMSERLIPGATNSVVSFIGKAVTRIRGQAKFDSYGSLKTFEGVVGTQGTLIYSEEPAPGLTVAFVSMQRNRVVLGDLHFAAVEFWILPTGGSPPVIIQQVHSNVTIGGTTVPNVLSAHIQYAFDARTAECRIVTPIKPPGTYDQLLVVTAGTATPNTLRFRGLVRDYDYTTNPGSVTTYAKGYLTRAVEYENSDDSSDSNWTGIGGLMLPDLVGSITGTSSAIVQAALTAANVPYTSSNIQGSSAIYGGGWYPPAFIWRNGSAGVNSIYDLAWDAGESAMSYIERYDNIDAELDSVNPNDGGRYRTYESVGGTIRRKRVGGRPQATPTITLTGTVDILGGSFKRSISQTRNYFVVKGQDRGQGFGPLSFSLQSANDFQPDTSRHTFSLSSDMIERALDSDTYNQGMSCETLCNALELEYNREIVTGWIETYRDDYFDLAQTHLVQGAPGGLTGYLGVGEPLWVQSVEISIDDRGFTQRLTYIGGGLA